MGSELNFLNNDSQAIVEQSENGKFLDPKYESVDEYLVLYLKEMTIIQQDRFQQLQKGKDGQYFRQNYRKNRYNNIIPYQHSMFNSETYTDFFNGNVVTLGDFELLVCQAPLYDQLNDFYTVIEEFQPKNVIQLTRFFEEPKSEKYPSVPKAERYVPVAPNELNVTEHFVQQALLGQAISQATQLYQAQKASASMTTVDYGKTSVLQLQKQFIERVKPQHCTWNRELMLLDNYVVQSTRFEMIEREFYKQDVQLSNLTTKQKTVFDFVYFGLWDDFAASSLSHIHQLCQLVIPPLPVQAKCSFGRVQEVAEQPRPKCVLHCSAGVGRSATFAVCMHIYREFQRKPQMNHFSQLRPTIFDAVEELRVRRFPSCVQTVEQFKFCFDFFEYCKEQALLLKGEGKRVEAVVEKVEVDNV